MKLAPRFVALVSLTLAAATLVACATTSPGWRPWKRSDRAFARRTKALEGRPVDDAIAALGYPKRELKSPSGSRVLEFETIESTSSPATATTLTSPTGSLTTVEGGRSSTRRCLTWLELDEGEGPAARVRKATWKGDACVSVEFLDKEGRAEWGEEVDAPFEGLAP